MATDWHPIYEAVRTAFAANSSLVAIAPATQWHADQIPDRKTFPALRYAILTTNPHQRLASGDNLDVQLQVDGYAQREEPTDLKTLMDEVVTALDRVNLTVTGFSRVAVMCVQRPTPFKEDPFFRMRTRFRMFGSAT